MGESQGAWDNYPSPLWNPGVSQIFMFESEPFCLVSLWTLLFHLYGRPKKSLKNHRENLDRSLQNFEVLWISKKNSRWKPTIDSEHLKKLGLRHMEFPTMSGGENQPLVTDKPPVECEPWLVEIEDVGKTTHPFRRDSQNIPPKETPQESCQNVAWKH